MTKLADMTEEERRSRESDEVFFKRLDTIRLAQPRAEIAIRLLKEDFDRLRATVRRLKREVKEARAAARDGFKEYAVHKSWCQALNEYTERQCDCGYEKAAEALEGK